MATRSWFSSPTGFGMWLAILVALCVLGWGIHETVQYHARSAWPTAPITVNRATIDRVPGDALSYVINVDYTYPVDGRIHRSQTFAPGRQSRANDPVEIQAELSAATVPGSVCHYHPHRPTEAYLVNSGEWFPFFLAPLVLLLYGLMRAGDFALWLRDRQQRRAIDARRPLSDNPTLPGSRLLLVGGVLLLAGWGAMVWFAWLWPLIQVQASERWTAIPAVIDVAVAQRHGGLHGPHYSAEVVYHYTFDGIAERGTRLDFTPISFMPAQTIHDLVAPYTAGATVTAWVDPTDRTKSVLQRRLRTDPMLIIFSLLLPAGAVAMLLDASRRRREHLGFTGRAMAGARRTNSHEPPVPVPVDTGPRTKVLLAVGGTMLALITLLWWSDPVIRGVLHGSIDIFAFFWLAAAVGGSAAFTYVLRQASGLRRTGPSLLLVGDRWAPGASVAIEVTTPSDTTWRMSLVIAETSQRTQVIHAHYGNAPDTRQISRVIHRRIFGEASGSIRLPIELPNLPSSLDAGIGGIRWWLEAREAVSGRLRSHPVVVLPAPASTGNGAIAGARRRVSDPHDERLALDLPAAAAPGTPLAIDVSWTVPERTAWLDLRLAWRLSSAEGGRAAVVDHHRVIDPLPHGRHTLSLRLPDAPPTWHGRLTRLDWFIEVVRPDVCGPIAVLRASVLVGHLAGSLDCTVGEDRESDAEVIRL